MIAIARNGLALWGAAALLLPLTVVDARTPAAPAKRVMLCGWMQNPTPGNWWIVDSKGEWTIGMQGGAQAKGMELIPDLSEKQWVKTNGYYGYGCGCMSATLDQKTKSVTRIYSFKQKPLATCRADKKLPKPD